MSPRWGGVTQLSRGFFFFFSHITWHWHLGTNALGDLKDGTYIVGRYLWRKGSGLSAEHAGCWSGLGAMTEWPLQGHSCPPSGRSSESRLGPLVVRRHDQGPLRGNDVWGSFSSRSFFVVRVLTELPELEVDLSLAFNSEPSAQLIRHSESRSKL